MIRDMLLLTMIGDAPPSRRLTIAEDPKQFAGYDAKLFHVCISRRPSAVWWVGRQGKFDVDADS